MAGTNGADDHPERFIVDMNAPMKGYDDCHGGIALLLAKLDSLPVIWSFSYMFVYLFAENESHMTLCESANTRRVFLHALANFLISSFHRMDLSYFNVIRKRHFTLQPLWELEITAHVFRTDMIFKSSCTLHSYYYIHSHTPHILEQKKCIPKHMGRNVLESGISYSSRNRTYKQDSECYISGDDVEYDCQCGEGNNRTIVNSGEVHTPQRMLI